MRGLRKSVRTCLLHVYVFIKSDFSIVVLVDAIEMPVELVLGDVLGRDTQIVGQEYP